MARNVVESHTTSSQRESMFREPAEVLIARIRDILRIHQDAASAVQLATMTPESVQNVLYSVIDALNEGGTVTQHQIGGDFLDENGVPRNRVLAGMDLPEFSEYPFLRHLVAKLVPGDTSVGQELSMHKDLQESLSTVERKSLRIPVFVDVMKSPEQQVILLERLPRDQKNMALQNFLSDALRARIRPVISGDLTGRIEDAISDMHSLGFLHGDINEGNFYLLNMKWEDLVIPQVRGRIRPSKVRALYSADVVVLDFERTVGSNMREMAGKHRAQTEDRIVADMLKERELDITEDATLDEVVEALDEQNG